MFLTSSHNNMYVNTYFQGEEILESDPTDLGTTKATAPSTSEVEEATKTAMRKLQDVKAMSKNLDGLLPFMFNSSQLCEKVWETIIREITRLHDHEAF